MKTMRCGTRLVESIADDLDEGALAAAPVEFPVKDLFPGPEIELAFGNGDDHLTAHDLPFHVRVGIVFAGPVMVVLGCRRMRRELFQPNIVIVQQAFLGVIDEDRSRDVHRIDQAKSFLHTAAADQFLDGGGDIDEAAAVGDFEPELLSQAFHSSFMPRSGPNQQPKPESRIQNSEF